MLDNLSRREREKLLRKNEILDAAEKLFFKKGFNNVSMDEIAKEAEFTKRTVYQYFTGKEDLYFGVASRGFKRMYEYTEKESKKGKNGFEMLYYSQKGYSKFCNENPETFRLMNFIGYIKKNDSPEKNDWLKFDDYLFDQITKVIELGIEDGSIRPDLNPRMTAFAIAFITTGLFNQIAETGKTFTRHFSLNEEEFTNYTIDLIFDSIKNK